MVKLAQQLVDRARAGDGAADGQVVLRVPQRPSVYSGTGHVQAGAHGIRSVPSAVRISTKTIKSRIEANMRKLDQDDSHLQHPSQHLHRQSQHKHRINEIKKQRQRSDGLFPATYLLPEKSSKDITPAKFQ